MRLLAWVDGQVVEASKFRAPNIYVMQRIHTLQSVAYNLEDHIEIMRRESERLFGFASVIGTTDAQRIIRRLVDLSRVGGVLSVPVVMRLDSRASLSFEVEKPTYGSGAYLRAKRDVAYPLRREMPTSVAQTSVSVALDTMSDCEVQHLGGNVALWVDAQERIISRPWLPVFVYFKGNWFTPTDHSSVEYRVVVDAIHKIGQKVYVRDIPVSALEIVDEVFVADIMGLTSISSINKHRLLSSMTNRIATVMEPKILE